MQPYDMPADGLEGTYIVGVRGLKESDGKMPPQDKLIKLYCDVVGRPHPILPWRICVSFSLFRVRAFRSRLFALLVF